MYLKGIEEGKESLEVAGICEPRDLGLSASAAAVLRAAQLRDFNRRRDLGSIFFVPLDDDFGSFFPNQAAHGAVGRFARLSGILGFRLLFVRKTLNGRIVVEVKRLLHTVFYAYADGLFSGIDVQQFAFHLSAGRRRAWLINDVVAGLDASISLAPQ